MKKRRPSNKVESHHKALQIYLGGQSALKQTNFLTVLKHSRDYIIAEYNDWEKICNGKPYKKTVLTENQTKRIQWLPNWIEMMESRIRLRKNMDTQRSLTKIFNLLTKHQF